MHPISSFNFGSSGIGVEFFNGSSVVGGYIVKQLGARKFKVTADGTNIFVCKLSANTIPAAGEMVIKVFPVAGGTEYVKHINSHVVNTIEGNTYPWKFSTSVEGEAQMAQYSNTPILAFSFSASVTENGSTNIDLTTHVTGSPTDYVISTPAHGMAAEGAGIVSYIPNSNYYGSDSFTFYAKNDYETSNTATVSITVNPAAPLAASFSANAVNAVAQAITLSSHISGGPFSNTSIVTGPVHGNAVISANTITYTATASYTGPDSITYRASGPGGSSTANIAITVH